jgi:hypothetical protein
VIQQTADRTDVAPAPGLLRGSAGRFVVAFVLLGVPLQLLRGPGVPVWRSVFGEDGGIFLTEALASRGWGSLLTPYQGYLQVASRVVAEFVAMLPLPAAAVAFAVISALVVSLLSAFVYSASAAVLSSRWARLAVAVAPLVLPAAYETTSNATDLHWYLDYACFWALLATPRRRWSAAPAAAIAALAVLSDPLAGLFLPLAGCRAATALGFAPRLGSDRRPRRSASTARYELVAPVTFGLGLLLQLALGVARQHAGQFRAAHWTDLPDIYGLRIAGSFLFGDRFLARAFTALGGPFALACLALVAAGIALALRRRASRRLVLLAAGYSVLWLCVPMVLRGTEGVLPQAPGALAGSRYTVVPILLLVVAGAAWLERLDARPRVLASVGFLLIAALSYTIPSQRSDGPVWARSLADAKEQCARTAGLPRVGGRSAEAPWGLPADPADVVIPVAPGGHPQWFVVTDCGRVGD